MHSPKEEADLPLLPSDHLHEKDLSQSEASAQQRYYQHQDTCDTLRHSVDKAAIRRRRQFCTIIATSLISCLTTLVIVAGLWTSMQEKASTPFIYDEVFRINSPSATGCGSTVSEAIALDCRFDELADLWLPRKCSQKYEEEYLRTNNGGPFLYWLDPEGKHVVTNRSQYAGGATYYSTTRDHLRHCEYNLYRFADSLTTGELVGHHNEFGPHMHHCAEILGRFANQATNIDNIDVDTVSTFGYC